ncbi:hypothetical protein [Caldithrix abyssi]
MLSQTFNILVLSEERDLLHLLKGILGATRYEISAVSSEEAMIGSLSQKHHDLIIIDQTFAGINGQTIKTLYHSFPDLAYIIIAHDLSSVNDWPGFKKINFVKKDQMESRLPLLLSNIYTAFNESHVPTLEYNNLIRTALDDSLTFTAIVHSDGDIVFLNRPAREILKIQTDEVEGLKFFDFLKDGEKVWQFLTMRWHDHPEQSISMDLYLSDKDFNEFPFPVIIKALQNHELYFIIQGKTLAEAESLSHSSDSSTLLKAFSESLANDLLNPLNVIWGRLQLFQSNPHLEQSDFHTIKLIERQLTRINDVISKLVAVTSLNRDLVPQRVFLNDVFKSLIQQPKLKDLLESQNSSIRFELDALPPIYGQSAQIELLLSTLIDLIFNLSGTNSRITISNKPVDKTKSTKQLVIDFKLSDATQVPDQLLLKSCLKFNEGEKKKFALETTIIRYLLDEYQIKHHLKDDHSTLILSLVFPLN